MRITVGDHVLTHKRVQPARNDAEYDAQMTERTLRLDWDVNRRQYGLSGICHACQEENERESCDTDEGQWDWTGTSVAPVDQSPVDGGAMTPESDNDWVYFRVKRPEGYEDVHPDMVLDDLLSCPRADWTVQVVYQGKDYAQTSGTTKQARDGSSEIPDAGKGEG